MANVTALAEQLQTRFGNLLQSCQVAVGQITIEVSAEQLRTVCQALRAEAQFAFDMLVDVCGVDYLHYGATEWRTTETTLTGFSRATNPIGERWATRWEKPRFAVVYHLLSLQHNHRLRLRTFAADEPPMVDSVIDIWPSANWFEREAFDLFGILFKGHPDLRRILTDYGFIGHPFRKDFPVSGNVEMRYDAALGRCLYEPVSIQSRTLTPKVIRQDNRYLHPQEPQAQGAAK